MELPSLRLLFVIYFTVRPAFGAVCVIFTRHHLTAHPLLFSLYAADRSQPDGHVAIIAHASPINAPRTGRCYVVATRTHATPLITPAIIAAIFVIRFRRLLRSAMQCVRRELMVAFFRYTVLILMPPASCFAYYRQSRNRCCHAIEENGTNIASAKQRSHAGKECACVKHAAQRRAASSTTHH